MTSQPANPTSDFEPDLIWFPIRVTATLSGGAMACQEVWTLPGGIVADKVGGRFNGATDPAYAIDGGTYAPTAAGSPVEVMMRRAAGSGGVQWEVKGFGGVSVPKCWKYPPVGEDYSIPGVGLQLMANPLLGSRLPTGSAFVSATGEFYGNPAGVVAYGVAVWPSSSGTPPDGTRLVNAMTMTPLAAGTPFVINGLYRFSPTDYICPAYMINSGSVVTIGQGQFNAISVVEEAIT